MKPGLKKKWHFILMSLFMAWPFMVFGQTISGIFARITSILTSFFLALFAFGVAAFIWGIVRFISAGGDPEKISSAKSLITWGLVGMFVLVAFWGLTQLISFIVFGTSTPLPPGNWPPAP